VAEELLRTAREMQLNADTIKAPNSFRTRTGLGSIHRFATALSLSMQYGTPTTQALRALAAEQLQDMPAKFEAKVGRLSVLLTLPMIIFMRIPDHRRPRHGRRLPHDAPHRSSRQECAATRSLS
jgi:pilus assembly protein TadC